MTSRVEPTSMVFRPLSKLSRERRLIRVACVIKLAAALSITTRFYHSIGGGEVGVLNEC